MSRLDSRVVCAPRYKRIDALWIGAWFVVAYLRNPRAAEERMARALTMRHEGFVREYLSKFPPYEPSAPGEEASRVD